MPSFSRGTDEEAWQEVEGDENWRHEIDISEYDPGTYNIVVRAYDLAGNEYVEGPFDIRIDPESDLPEVNFVYPEPGQVVRTNINVVGSATDDDGVARVEYRINEGGWNTADGAEHWSDLVDAGALPDGRYTIEARATDIDGTQGHITSVDFILDTEPPRIRIDSHEGGAIVSGRVEFEGIAWDDNEIARVEVSRDGGETWERERTRFDRDEEVERFGTRVRTTDLEDGPHVFWLRATNTTGAQHEIPFLFFVNNEAPALEVIEPEAESPAYGTVHIAGSVRDDVGIERLWYEWGGEGVDLPLTPGNPYWSIELDVTEESGRWVDVPIHAEDVSGNVATLDYRLANEPERAEPVVELREPDPETLAAIDDAGKTLPHNAALYGVVRGAYQAEAVIVEGLEEEPVELAAEPGFRIPLEDAPAGSMDLRVRGRNELGIEGEAVRLRFDRRAEPPRTEIVSLVYDDDEVWGEPTDAQDERPFVSGKRYDRLAEAQLIAHVHSKDLDDVTAYFGRAPEAAEDVEALAGPETPEPDGELWVEARVRTRSTDDPEVTRAEISIPDDVRYGAIPVVVRAVDDFGTHSTYRTMLDVRDTRRIEGDPRIILEDVEVDNGPTVRLFGDRPLYGRVVGESGGAPEERIDRIELDPEPAEVRLEQDGPFFAIHARRTGIADSAELTAYTANGLEIEWGTVRFAVDTADRPTSVTIDRIGDEEDGQPYRQGFSLEPGERPELAGTVTAAEEPDDLVLRVDGEEVGSSRLRSVEEREDRWSFSLRLPRGLAYGEYALSVAALDEDGDVLDAHEGRFFVLSEGEPPADPGDITLLEPRPEAELGDVGRVLRSPAAEEAGLGASTGLSWEEHEFSDPDPRRARTLRFDGPESIGGVFRGRPVARVELAYEDPAAGDRDGGVENDGGDGGEDSGDDGGGGGDGDAGPELTPSDLVSVSADGRRIELVPEESGMAGPFELVITTVDGMEYRDGPYHAVVRLDDPELWLDESPAGGYFNELVELTGRASDPVAEPEVSYRVGYEGRRRALALDDGGRFSEEAMLDLITEPGARDIFVRVEGALGAVKEAWLPVNFDPVAPEVRPVTPPAGTVTAGTNEVFGRIDSGSPITSVEYSVDGAESWESLPARDTFSVEIDFSALERRGERALFRAEDAARNVAELEAEIPVDLSLDMPEVEIQTPEEDAIVTSDFRVSGTAFDDSGVAELYYRIVIPDKHDVDGRARGRPDDPDPEPAPDPDSDPEPGEDEEGNGRPQEGDDQADGADEPTDDGDDAAQGERDGPNEEPPEFRRLPGANNFDIDVSLDELVDNDQRIEVYAVNENGVPSEVVTSTFHVSLREPIIDMEAPHVEEMHRGTVELRGTAYDENEVAEVRVSFDHGNTYQSVDGTDEWRYELDTQVFPDGTYPIEIEVVDGLGIKGRYFSLINIDNTPPEITLADPENASAVADTLPLSGRVEDNRRLRSVKLSVEPVGTEGNGMERELGRGLVLQEDVDISELEPGWYKASVEATDEAGNTRSVSRSIHVQDEAETTSVSLLMPVQGATHYGTIPVQGRVTSPFEVRSVQLYVDDSFVDGVSVDELGYFRYELSADELGGSGGGETVREVHAAVDTADDERVESERRRFNYQEAGPNVRIESHNVGDFIAERPWLRGTAEYSVPGAGGDGGDGEAPEVSEVAVSLDDGVTFDSARGGDEWRYRLPTHEMEEGAVSVLIRAEFDNGERAYTRSMLTVDRTPPQVTMRSPAEGDVLNTTLEALGTASDDHGLQRVEAALRPGGKAGYSVPAFIQGMYVDANAMGIPYLDAGVGFTFFDDNVRLQAQYGRTPEGQRFSGQVIGGKLLANVASIPFSTFFGPDWEFLSANLALGANFSYILLDNPDQMEASDAPGVVLSAVLAQFEFPRIDIEGWDVFNSYSLYTEPEVWFVPSDVEPAIEARMSFGLRIGLF